MRSPRGDAQESERIARELNEYVRAQVVAHFSVDLAHQVTLPTPQRRAAPRQDAVRSSSCGARPHDPIHHANSGFPNQGQFMSEQLRLAADIGGTFTDVAVFDESTGKLNFGKALSTPKHLVEGINNGVAKAGADYKSVGLFLHGSTVGINTILERRGAKTALIITKGFRDIYEIGRINRPDSYNLFFQKHEPLVERALRFEVNERILADGEVEKPLDDKEIEALGDHLASLGMEAIAILFLHCYRKPDHEQRAKAILQKRHPNIFVSASHELSQEYREFERCSTVVANAYIGPIVDRYVGGIDNHIRKEGFKGSFLIVQSTGGLYDSSQARQYCIRMLESGPAAGVIGTRTLCQTLGLKNAIAFDMGGTTAKAGVIHDGEPLTTGSALLGGYEKALPVQIAMMDIFEVGTGGGSIAKVEDGMLRVGPQSAGASPGPACYGLGGTEPTVTDANLALGRLGADRFLGGEMKLDTAAAKKALDDPYRRAARHGCDASRGRHPAHRRHRDVLRGQRRHHRARPRCRRLRARRLWRRRAAARGGSRARARHAPGHRARGAGRVLRLWHAVLRSALRFCAHLVHAARRRVLRRDRGRL